MNLNEEIQKAQKGCGTTILNYKKKAILRCGDSITENSIPQFENHLCPICQAKLSALQLAKKIEDEKIEMLKGTIKDMIRDNKRFREGKSEVIQNMIGGFLIQLEEIKKVFGSEHG